MRRYPDPCAFCYTFSMVSPRQESMALTQESLLSFLLEHGGKVKNSELLNNFRSLINCSDPAEKQHNRDLFKKLVNSVAVVKQIDDVKFVVVKKRYQDFVKEVQDVSQKTQLDDSFSSQVTRFSYTSPRRAESARIVYTDNENNSASSPLSIAQYYSDAKRTHVENVLKKRPLSSGDLTTVKVLNVSGDQTCGSGKSGAVFAVIAVKSPPRDSAPAAHDDLHSQVLEHESSNKPVTQVSLQPALTSNFSACKRDSLKESHSWKTRQTEDMQPPGSPLVRPQNKTTRQVDDARYSESVPLEPLAHEWLVKCAAGLWGQIYALLLRDTRLVQRKDFISGFTALHWAAKDGNNDMIQKLIDISRKKGAYVNVNCKAHGGYTPLHIAAMHGHTKVMVLLVQKYGANANERDNDGKKALHYLGKGVSTEVRGLLGGLLQSKEKTEDEECKEQTKGLNTISKLFQPHIGKKHKTTMKFAQELYNV
ncbi:ankyrin repeat domain-containing protein SOWAHA [Melanotaenia boesemani]|uniref:ankyrin repeat domain-containing protein SOWAHA n=1 Tax=Melanotaenia boesemani TaxID=1250792 RepID=UPI001C056326|nr:ankyrin repeat domain-containing protein SOWAHA [Melanotaenia boesemani]